MGLVTLAKWMMSYVLPGGALVTLEDGSMVPAVFLALASLVWNPYISLVSTHIKGKRSNNLLSRQSHCTRNHGTASHEMVFETIET